MKLQNAIAAALMVSAPLLASAETYSRMDTSQEPVVVVYKVIGSENGQATGNQPSYDWKTIRVDEDELDATIKRLKMDATIGDIEISGKVEPIDPVKEDLAPSFIRSESVSAASYNDPFLDRQVVWETYDEATPGKLSISLAQSVFDTSRTMVIGFIDGGFVETNDIVYKTGVNMISGERGNEFRANAIDPNCDYRHGTEAAHLSAAISNNGIGIAGIARAEIVAARVFDCGALSLATDISDSVLYLAGEAVSGISTPLDVPVDVINMSLSGGGACPGYVQDAIDVARSKGSLVVVAAGNDTTDAQNRFPANCKGVITVGSNNFSGERSGFSNFGETVDIYATGRGLFTMKDSNVYTFVSGTSFAAPIVAGHAALIKSVEFDADDRRVLRLLTATQNALVPDNSGADTAGRGIMNSFALAQAVDNGAFTAEPMSHALVNEDRANAEAYTQDAANLNTCNLYDVDTTKLALTRPDGFEFRVLEVAEGADFTVANGSVVATSQGTRVLLKNIDPSANDYGLSTCDVGTGVCESPIPINLNAEKAFTQAFCPSA